MIEQLKAIGLTEVEAKCYLALYENPNQSGYEVAKNIGVSRSNVYASLNSLHKKGGCLISEGKTTTYTAVPIDEVLDKLRQEFKESSRALKRQFRKQRRDTYNFYTAQGREDILNVIKRSIAHAQNIVIADVWSRDLEVILPMLEEAQERQLKVVLITDAPIETRLNHVVSDFRSKDNEAISDFSILCDREKAIIGTLDDNVVASAVETLHPAIVKKIESEYHHDLIVSKISEDLHEVIQTNYKGDLYSIVSDFETTLD